MKNHLLFTIFTASGLFHSAAFGTENFGFNDYAKAYLHPTESCVPFVRKYESVCGGNFDGDRQAGYDNRARPNVCTKPNSETSPIIQIGDMISINLLQAYIHNFTETTFFSRKRGEIAIVARVVERDEKNGLDFTDTGKQRGRLVYYSEGVQPGQYLNFSQLPIYGPIEYKGNQLILEFYIVELDMKESAEISGLLSTVASLGGTAYPPSSSILKTLEKIGSELLKPAANDTEFKYHATLVPATAQFKPLRSGILEYGNYAFVKMPYKQEDFGAEKNIHPWSNWYFNQKNARLYGNANCSDAMTSHTYLMVQINKGAGKMDATNNYGEFLATLTSQVDASVKTKLQVVDSLKESITNQAAYRSAKDLIEKAAEYKKSHGKLSDLYKQSLKNISQGIGSSISANTPPTTPTTPTTPTITPPQSTYDEYQSKVLVRLLGNLLQESLTYPEFKAADVNGLIDKL